MAGAKVSVLVPTYNRAHLLPQCLDSILGQTIPPAQVIVVNDGSTDNTQAVLEAYKDRIEYIEKPNEGKPAALNLGLTRVTGEYVWIMDDDDVAFPDALERHLSVLESHPELGFTYSSHYLARSRAEDQRIQPVKPQNMPDVPEEELLSRLMEANFITFQGMLVRTSCYRQVGPFDEQLIRSEDYDMVLRLVRRFHCTRVSGPTFYYREHEGSRGSAVDTFPAQHSRLKFREYDQKVFRKLRKELEAHEYLPRTPDDQGLGPVNSRRAYLQRMVVMASKGLYEEMTEDLGLALADQSDRRPFSDTERALLRRAMALPWQGAELFTRSTLIRRIRKLCHGDLGQQVQLELARGLYWRACGAWGQKHYRESLRVMLAFVRLLGIKGLLRAFVHKLGSA